MTGAGDFLRFIEQIKRVGETPRDFWTETEKTPAPESPLYRQIEITTPPPPATHSGDLAESRVLLGQVIGDYIAEPMPDYMLLVKTLPGTGKTTAAVHAAEVAAQAGKRVFYAGPRHDFFQDILEKADQHPYWYEWLPRQNGDDNKVETCRYTPEISEWMNRGYKGIDFCSGVCGWDYVNKGCPYHAQKERPEPILYVQHQHVVLGHPLESNVLIGDESPIGAFLWEWGIPSQYIVPENMSDSEPIKEILFNLSLVAQNATWIEGKPLIDLLGGAESVLSACDCLSIPADAMAQAPHIYRADQAATTPFFHLPRLAHLLRREAGCAKEGVDYPHRIIAGRGELTLYLRHPVSDTIPWHVVWLDATANPRLYEEVFKREIKVVDIQPALQGKIYQVVDRANGKSTLLEKSGELTAKSNQLIQQIKTIVKSNRYTRPALISFQKFVENSDLPEIQSGHFYAARGTNQFEACDAIIIAGTPQPSLLDISKLAKMIFFERDTPFQYAQWTDKPMLYQYTDPADGMGRAYPVSGYWNDPDLQAILSTVREDEILQAAHRARPVNRPVDIWLLLNMPISGLPPDQLLTIQNVMGAPDKVDSFLWAKTKEIALRIAENQGFVGIKDLVDALDIRHETASKYMGLLVSSGEWEVETIRPVGRGQPPKMIHPIKKPPIKSD